jgi:alpha-ketoglutarate-dependent taurine dioxygenase
MKFYKKLLYTNAAETSQELKQAIKEYKVVHVAEFKHDMPIEDFYSQLSEVLGVPHSADEDLLTGKRLENRWIDIAYDPMIQDRYRTSNTRQPLHTDDSYVELYGEKAIQFFYCKSRAAMGGATTFFDLDMLIECMQIDEKKELIDRLINTVVNFEKSGSKKVRNILDKDQTSYLVNYNYYCIDKDNTPEALQLVEDFQHYLETRIIMSGVVLPVQLEVGEAVFFHDDRLLHGRNAYFAKTKGERCLIKGKIILDAEFAFV